MGNPDGCAEALWHACKIGAVCEEGGEKENENLRRGLLRPDAEELAMAFDERVALELR